MSGKRSCVDAQFPCAFSLPMAQWKTAFRNNRDQADMVKRLHSRNNRGAACRLLIAAAFAVVVATWAGEAFAEIWCATGDPDTFDVPCGDPTAYYCHEIVPEDDCNAAGFITSDGGVSFHRPPAPVPELEDYAAAAFVTLALLIGWRVRRSFRPAG